MPRFTLRKRKGSDNWYISWTEDSVPKKRTTGTKDHTEAQKILGAFIEEYENELAGNNLTVCQALNDYYREHVKVKLSAPERTAFFRKALNGFFDDIPIRTIKRQDSRLYAEYRREQSIGDSTIRKELQHLVAAMNHAVKEKRLDKYDVPAVDLPKEPPGKELWLTHEQASALLGECRFELVRGKDGRFKREEVSWITPEYLFVMIALHAAPRRGAIENLTWFQVDMKRRVINFKKRGEVQTSKRKPVVPISDTLLPVLEQAYRERKNEYVLGSNKPMYRPIKKAMKRAGLSEEYTPHTLRHTWATWAAQSGVPIFNIAGVLGDSVATTEKRYAHHSPDYLVSAVNTHEVK